VWEAIGYVSSGVSLVAFVVAVAAWLYKSQSESKERLIQQAAEADRAELVKHTLEFFHVETKGLTKQQQAEVALEQIRARTERFRIVAIVVCFLSVVAGGVSVYAISHDESNVSSEIASSEQDGGKRERSPEDTQRILSMISEFADRLCKDIPLAGTGENNELSGNAKRELSKFVGEIVDLKLAEAKRFQSAEYQGLLQEDLVAALKQNADCRLQVFKELSLKLLSEN
jgi:hypothetical protein